MTDRISLHGVVDKIIVSPTPEEPEKAQIDVEEADNRHREIRIDNALTGEDGQEVKLKLGGNVEIIIQPKKKDQGN
jgi:hypothetical protein